MATEQEIVFDEQDIAAIEKGKKAFDLLTSGESQKTYFEICVELGDENRN